MAISRQLDFLLKTELEAVHNVGLLKKDLEAAAALLVGVSGKVIVSGVGKSGYIGMKMSGTFASLGIPSFFLNPHEALHGDLGALGSGDALLAISTSGEAKELLKIIAHAKTQDIPVIGITATKKSSLAKASTIALVIKISEEGSPHNLAPMASATATLVLGDMLAMALCLKKGFNREKFATVHPGGSLGLKSASVASRMKKNVPSVLTTASFQKVLHEISDKRMGITAVTSGRRFVGVISDGDIRRFLQQGIHDLAKITANDMMTPHPKTISEKATLHEALELMEHGPKKITSLFIIDARRGLNGIIHLHDIVHDRL